MIPFVKIGGAVAGGRDDRNDLEQAISKAVFERIKIAIARTHSKQNNCKRNRRDDQDISPKLDVFKKLKWFPDQDQKQ